MATKTMTRWSLIGLGRACNNLKARPTRLFSGFPDEIKGKERLKKPQEASVYIHWPYCERLCTYCNFNKYVRRTNSKTKTVQDDVEAKMVRCLIREAGTVLGDIARIESIKSVYFGGGTPSLMAPDSVSKVLKGFNYKADATEVTLEVNPGDVGDPGRLSAFLDAGINRISLGLQALNDEDLRLLNRSHDVKTGLESLERILGQTASRGNGPKAVSVDLIFGRPGQTLVAWDQELKHLLDTFPEIGHVSLYQLTVEEGTKLWRDVRAGKAKVADEDLQADMYDLAVARMKDSGLIRYEVSNFARGSEARSVHNRNYWAGGDFVGLGPGASSRFWVDRSSDQSDTVAWKVMANVVEDDVNHDQASRFEALRRQSRVQTLEPDHWMAEVETLGHGTRKIEVLSQSDLLVEILASSLRTTEGLSEPLWEDRLRMAGIPAVDVDSGHSFRSVFGHHRMCRKFFDNGTVVIEPDVVGVKHLRMSEKGLQFLDHVLPYLVSAVHDQIKGHS